MYIRALLLERIEDAKQWHASLVIMCWSGSLSLLWACSGPVLTAVFVLVCEEGSSQRPCSEDHNTAQLSAVALACSSSRHSYSEPIQLRRDPGPRKINLTKKPQLNKTTEDTTTRKKMTQERRNDVNRNLEGSCYNIPMWGKQEGKIP